MDPTVPFSPEVVLEEALAHHKGGRPREAETGYRAILAHEPRHPIANHNLGIVLAQAGQVAQSLPLFEAALEAEPGVDTYRLSLARALLAANDAGRALTVLGEGKRFGLSGPAFDALLARAQAARKFSADPDGLFEAAVHQHKLGKMDEAIRLYRQAIAADPRRLEAYENFGVALIAGGHHEEAVKIYRQALQVAPDNAAMLDNLGYAYTVQGNIEDAIASYRQAIALKPDFAEAYNHLGSVLSENGRIAEGFEAFMMRARLVYGNGKAPPRQEAEPLHKIKHDREQRDYLAGGKAPDDAPAVADMFHIEHGERLEGPAVNPANATAQLLDQWNKADPQLVVIENILTDEALKQLRLFCAGSTVWRRLYSAGYIGAIPADGFAAPLLAQIAEELISTYPQILKPHKFHYLGAFKYDSELSTGTNTHADFSTVNVNFYITPDEANLDPASGGMEVWDVAAADTAQLRRLNADENAVREFLKTSGARSTIIPHKANRGVIFKSHLFHKTDNFKFREGYLNKRINVSLLFGTFK